MAENTLLTDKSYISRPFRESDLAEVIRLRGIVFGKDRALNFSRTRQWHFNENPALKSCRPRSWVVEAKGSDKDEGDKNRIAGYISVTPGILQAGDNKIVFVWGGDLMSDPEQRGKGIGKEMVRRWKEESNICLALGVGDVAYGIESKMGWTDIGVGKAMIKIIDAEKFMDYALKTKKSIFSRLLSKFLGIFLKIFLRTKRPDQAGNIDIVEIRKFGRSFDDLWAGISGDLGIAVARDSKYLDWRYLKNPNRKFKIFAAVEKKTRKMRGYIILTEVSSENFRWGRVVDFVASPYDNEAMQALISCSVNHFEKRGCEGIQAYGMKKGHRKMFSRNGFINSSSMYQRFIVKVGKKEPGRDHGTDYFNPDNWFITAGDSDFTI